jgi:hypothetical protein
MLTWINAGRDVGMGLPKCQAMHPVFGQSRQSGRRQTTSGLPPGNGHRQADPACPKSAHFRTHAPQQMELLFYHHIDG